MHGPSDECEAATDNASKLFRLAREKFGTLSQAEEKLFQATAKGKFADYRTDSEEDNDPAGAEKWGDERVLKADRIAWLCTDSQASGLVTCRGIVVKGARIDGELDLELAEIAFPLHFEKSALAGGINLEEAQIHGLYLRATHSGAIKADGMEVERSVVLTDGFKAEGQVRLIGARIKANLECDKGEFIDSEGDALVADGLRVDGNVFMRNGFKANGQVRLLGATIGGNLECDEGQIVSKNKETKALFADGVKVHGSVYLRNGFKAKGEVCLLGATINGSLECGNGEFINPKDAALTADGLDVGRSVFLSDGFEAKGEVRLSGATIGGQVDCSGGQFISKNKEARALSADDMNVQGSVFLSNGFKAEGSVCLRGATIGGHLECESGQLMNPDGYALSADRLKVEGCIHLCNGFKAQGSVCLVGARIGGSLNCAKGQFINPEGCALNGNGLKVEGAVLLENGFRAQGEVRLHSATIGGYLNCEAGQFINKKKEPIALFADGLKVEGGVFLRKGFKGEGEVRLPGATIGGNLECDQGQFINDSGCALNADAVKVDGYVFLRNGFKAEGEVCLLVARIGRNLECDNGQFVNRKKGAKAFNADGLKVEGDVLMRNSFRAEGEVRLLGATIGGSLECDNSQFINPAGDALNADGVEVGGYVFLRNGFRAQGEVCLLGARIGGNLECENGQFVNRKKGGMALNADGLKVERDVFMRNGFRAEGKVYLCGATIGGAFVWTDVASPPEVTLDLRSATVGTLWDDQKSWPEKGRLFLHGLVYGEIEGDAPRDAKTRLDWLRRQPTEHFRAQPYEQLAAVLRRGGHDADAKKILIAKARDRASLTQLTWAQKCWYHFFGKLIGFGYRPWRAFGIGLVVVVLGWLLFGIGFRADVMTPTKGEAYVPDSGGENRQLSENYPKFNPLVYSLDMFVPLVDLHQASYWLPDAGRGAELVNIKGFRLVTGSLLRYYLWSHIIMGWILTTLLVVGLSGLVRS